MVCKLKLISLDKEEPFQKQSQTLPTGFFLEPWFSFSFVKDQQLDTDYLAKKHSIQGIALTPNFTVGIPLGVNLKTGAGTVVHNPVNSVRVKME